jgi:4'-phosphopantetheinyl transferase
MNIDHWRNQQGTPAPTKGKIHLWLAWLDEEDPVPFKISLSADELRRAERLRDSRYANRFIVGRGILRTILGSYLSCNPEQVVFSYGAHGKPELAEKMNTKMAFSVSHSGSLAIYAIGFGCKVGVDIETIHAISDVEATASIFLSAEELSQFKEIPAEEKLKRFFNLWTSKEAILKATGTGFSTSVSNIISNFYEPGARVIGQLEIDKNKRLWSFVPAEGFRGALACL